jgi:hypothetical protein
VPLGGDVEPSKSEKAAEFVRGLGRELSRDINDTANQRAAFVNRVCQRIEQAKTALAPTLGALLTRLAMGL